MKQNRNPLVVGGLTIPNNAKRIMCIGSFTANSRSVFTYGGYGVGHGYQVPVGKKALLLAFKCYSPANSTSQLVLPRFSRASSEIFSGGAPNLVDIYNVDDFFGGTGTVGFEWSIKDYKYVVASGDYLAMDSMAASTNVEMWILELDA